MTTTELIKVLKDNECGGISHKPREISLSINGKYMPNPQITLSSTGDGVCGPEIDLDIDGDIDGDFMEEQEPKGHWITEDMFDGDVAYRCSKCSELFWIETGTPKDNEYNYCPKCGAKLESEVEDELL